MVGILLFDFLSLKFGNVSTFGLKILLIIIFCFVGSGVVARFGRVFVGA